MNALMVIGLCLLAPTIIITVGCAIYEIEKIVKEDPTLGVLLITFVMGIVGSALLIISLYQK
jgi:hypothetical protein